jgi:hypothetical protein
LKIEHPANAYSHTLTGKNSDASWGMITLFILKDNLTYILSDITPARAWPEHCQTNAFIKSWTIAAGRREGRRGTLREKKE